MNQTKNVLVVDDEQGMRELLEIVLSNDGYNVTLASSVEDACQVMDQSIFDAVITDLRMGNDHEAGMEILRWIHEHQDRTPSIMMTAHGSVETAIQAMKQGATDYIMKPFKNDEIKLLLERAIQQHGLIKENKVLKKEQAKLGQVKNMVGVSDAIEQVREMVRRIAVLPSTIAIHGESGVGKELVARSLHQLSDRSSSPFVAINCGGIPENLLESELFGHKKGTFTGAMEDKEGLFLAADGGTIFLDEIGEMPLSLQVKLLRVLDNHTITPLGSTNSIPVDVRIVSATNRDLEEMSKQGTFREDLFYRLNVIPLLVPPLRDRKDDIPLLMQHFTHLHGEKMGRGTLRIAPEVMDVLLAYRWPGNVRELGNIIERAVALCNGDSIELTDLPPNIQNFMPAPAHEFSQLPSDGVDMEELIAEIEMGLIQQALRKTKHSQKKAAGLLGLTARSLRYRLQKYDLDNNSES